jgi:hypothetical protein
MAHRSIAAFAVVSFLSFVSCQGSGSSGTGVTIPASDATSPTLTLGAGQPGGQNVAVNVGGSVQGFALPGKTGVVNLVATAKDPESGVQAVEIWVNQEIYTCTAILVCSKTGPGLLSQPTFESSSPKLNPGETTSEASVLAEALDLGTVISQGTVPADTTRTTTLIIWAEARNHLAGAARTPEIRLTLSEP